MASPQRPKLTGSILLHEAVAAATATLVRVVRRYPRSANDAKRGGNDPRDTDVADDIITEARLLSPLPAAATPRESARAAITLELLSTPASAARLLNVAARFNANNNATNAVGGGGGGCGFSAASPSHDTSPLSPASLFPTETVAGTFVAQALQRWPTLGCGCSASERTVDFFHCVVREGAVETVRRVRKVTSWLVSHGPDGDGSLVFDTDSELERLWMNKRTKLQQWTVDYVAYTFIVAFQVGKYLL
jgi:hypothetical protein